jgi:predicted transcriptional regulator of viral defense system
MILCVQFIKFNMMKCTYMTDRASRNSAEVLYRIAEPQAGYFTSAQGMAAGIGHQLLAHHAKRGHIIRVRRGIYRLVLFPTGSNESLFVAWLEAGSQAVISHDSALALYGLADASPEKIHITIPRTASRRHPKLKLHTGRLTPEEVTRCAGLPVTTISRTLADVVAAGLKDELAVEVIARAIQKGMVSWEGLSPLNSRYCRRMESLFQAALIRCGCISGGGPPRSDDHAEK